MTMFDRLAHRALGAAIPGAAVPRVRPRYEVAGDLVGGTPLEVLHERPAEGPAARADGEAARSPEATPTRADARLVMRMPAASVRADGERAPGAQPQRDATTLRTGSAGPITTTPGAPVAGTAIEATETTEATEATDVRRVEAAREQRTTSTDPAHDERSARAASVARPVSSAPEPFRGAGERSTPQVANAPRDTIRVHIGRVDVRAVFPAPVAPPPRPAERPGPAMTLDKFLSNDRDRRR